MRREDIPPGGTGTWAVRLTVDTPRRPATRVESAAGNRFLLRQDENVALFGRIRSDYEGVDVIRTGRYTSPLPPIRADHPRRVADGDPISWYGRWAHQYASWLADSTVSPLYAGEWILTGRRVDDETPHWNPRRKTSMWIQYDVAGEFPGTFLDWADGWAGILPMRPIDEKSPRVAAFRKRVLDGTLPPVLLLWLSCLDGYLLLDGHDRMAAALSEKVDPPILLLHPSPDATKRESVTELMTGGHELAMRDLRRRDNQLAENAPGPAREQARRELDRDIDRQVKAFGTAVVGLSVDTARTTAWPCPGGVPEWNELARTWLGADWPADR